MNQSGRHVNDVRAWKMVARFKLTWTDNIIRRILTPKFIDQLERCADDSARRLLLGVSR